MSVVELDRSPARFESAEDRQAAARDWYAAAVAAGRDPTGDDVGRHFGRSGRWGRDRIAEAAAEQPDGDDGSQPAADGRDLALIRRRTIQLVVGLVAAAASYGHMLHVALMAGESLWIARAFPITVDGLALAALEAGDEGRRWLALALVISVAANVVAQFPGLAADAGPVVAAVPPLALYGCHRLLHAR